MKKDNDGMELVDANINLQQSFPADLQIQKAKTTADTVYIQMKSNT